jgi:Zn finger protein HypA/HybF involved in hydrogenase expression
MQIVKSEWHQVEKRYGVEINEAVLSEIYPDYEEAEITQLLADLESGEADLEEVINDAWNNDCELDWEYLNDDDWWTDRKGGYEVTYSAEEWVIREDYVAPTIWKCTSCKWTGGKWDTNTEHCREDGSVIEDYYSTEEESHHTKECCPMCDSDLDYIDEETRISEENEKRKREERAERLAKQIEEEEEQVDCYSCGIPHKESELPEMSGQYICPTCGEGWIMAFQREEEPVDESELEEALEKLKREFDELMSHTHACTECDWEGKEDQLADELCPSCHAPVKLIERNEDE